MAPIGTWTAVVLAAVLGHVDASIRIDASRGQAPLGSVTHTEYTHSGRLSYTPRLNFSSSAPHLFASAYGLLQQWSNTVFPNGHAVAAATIPPFTLMYHGLHVDEETAAKDPEAVAPPSPEWLAFDIEMAYGIMGSTRQSWLLTYQTTRPIQVLYVDGESAALMGLGQLDSQMLLLYGNVTGPANKNRGFGLTDEYDRARGMCDWLQAQNLGGRGWGYEGIVRMNAGFELIWCDFMSDSLRLVSRLNVTAPLVEKEVEQKKRTSAASAASESAAAAAAAAESYYPLPPVPTRSDRVVEPTNPPAPPNWRGGRGGGGGDDTSEEPFLTSQGWGWFESATWHYGGSRAGPGAGETRVQIDNCGIVSYYAPQFAGSALAASRGLEERQRLNLTDDGFWEADASATADTTNRTVALRQLARRRRFHHLGNASEADAQLMRHSALTTLQRTVLRKKSLTQTARVEQFGELDTPGSLGSTDTKTCSGASWTLILSEIVQRMTRHLKNVESILLEGPGLDSDSKLNSTATRAWLHKLRSQNHMFMVGYLSYPQTANTDASVWQPNTALFKDTLALCRFRYTRLFGEDYNSNYNLPREEDDMRWAIEETYGTMCGELLGIGFDVERKWAEHYVVADEADEKSDLAESARVWYDQLTDLIAWLGWESEFIGCDRVCGWHERCFIPMWPLMSSKWGRGEGPGGGRHGRRPDFGRDPNHNETGGPGGPGHEDPGRGGPGRGGPGHGGPGGGGSGGGGPGFGFPRSPEMMGDDTDLWEPKCVGAWYIMGNR